MTRHALSIGTKVQNKITVRGSISGMRAGDHSFHFHEHGDMSAEGEAVQATNPVYSVTDLPFDTVSDTLLWVVCA
jgi:hypothetical protein